MQQRNQEREKKRALVQHTVEDDKGPLDIAAAHRREDGLVEMHAHRRSEQHDFIHHDFETERLVNEQNDATDADECDRGPVDGSPAQLPDFIGPSPPKGVHENRESEQHEPKSGLGNEDDRLLVRYRHEPEHQGQNGRK